MKCNNDQNRYDIEKLRNYAQNECTVDSGRSIHERIPKTGQEMKSSDDQNLYDIETITKYVIEFVVFS